MNKFLVCFAIAFCHLLNLNRVQSRMMEWALCLVNRHLSRSKSTFLAELAIRPWMEKWWWKNLSFCNLHLFGQSCWTVTLPLGVCVDVCMFCIFAFSIFNMAQKRQSRKISRKNGKVGAYTSYLYFLFHGQDFGDRFFSTQKYVNRNNMDFASKQHKSRQNSHILNLSHGAKFSMWSNLSLIQNYSTNPHDKQFCRVEQAILFHITIHNVNVEQTCIWYCIFGNFLVGLVLTFCGSCFDFTLSCLVSTRGAPRLSDSCNNAI